MRPPLPVEFRAASLGSIPSPFRDLQDIAQTIPQGLVAAWFDGMERHTGKDVPVAETCTRRDNAVSQGPGCASSKALYNHTTAVRDRRILVADDKRGIVLAVSMIDNPGLGPANLPASQLVPSTYMVPQLIKVDGGAISRVEGMVKWMPFGYTSAWAESKK